VALAPGGLPLARFAAPRFPGAERPSITLRMKAWRGVADKYMKVEGGKCRDIFRQMTFRQIEYAILESPVLQLVSLAKQAGFGIETIPNTDPDVRDNWMALITHFSVEVFDAVFARPRTNDPPVAATAVPLMATNSATYATTVA